MATFSKPLISAAALAGAAAVAVATPAIMPSVGVPTPGALSRAAYELTTFSDLLSIPSVVWTDVLFGNQTWGGTLSSTTYGPAWAKPTAEFGTPNYINPWAAYCTGNSRCQHSGIPGVLYMASDALINGNGNGYADYDNWPIGIVNYFWEPGTASLIGGGSSPTVQFSNNGFSAATWYALAGTIGQAVPSLQVPIAAAFWGPDNVGVFFSLALNIAAATIENVPLVGPITANSIRAYLGDLQIPGTTDFYQYGLSGTLNYWIDIATGSVPFPTASVAPVASAASVVAPVRGASTETPAADAVAGTPVKPNTIAVGEPNPAGEAPESTPAADYKPADKPDSAALESTQAKAPESTPESSGAGSTPESSAPESGPVADDLKADDLKADDLKADDLKADDLKADADEASDPKSTSVSDNKAVDTTPEFKLDLPAADEVDSAPTGSSAGTGSGAENASSAASKESSASAGSDASDAGSAKSDAGSAKSDAGSAKSDSDGGGDSDSAK